MKKKGSIAFGIGGVCLAFLVLGYQASLFVHRAAVLRIAQARDCPDTVYVADEATVRRVFAQEGEDRKGDGSGGDGGTVAFRRDAGHPPEAQAVRRSLRKVESFRFNPNTVSVEDLMRLGFSEKQARSIDNYRIKGGRFRRKEDFAKSFVVADSVYHRLEKYIDIPLLDINKADSAAFDALPGIGPYFASRMVSYRTELGGYSYPEQLMDIYRFDAERYGALKDLVCCSRPPRPFRLWSLPADSLRRHPYIRSWQAARAIVLYRNNTAPSERRVEELGKAGIIPDSLARKLARCFIE